jgi:DNA-binding NtrC family response regulator
MMVLLLESPNATAVEARLRHLGFTVRRFDLDEVMDLGRETSESVYVVPRESLAEPSWPQLRVRLSQANRYYVVAGDRLDSAQIIHAARDGAYDVLQLADTDSRWVESLKKAADSQTLWIQLYGGSQIPEPDALLGQSAAMRSLRQAIERLGPTVASVLILGESGVGKERVANALHAASGRGAFVAVNCAAIPKELMEAELFGAEKGAYTGATKTRAGLVEQASGGTLFLDEIGELEVRLQPKLLRFLETRKARRVGGSTEIQSEVRVLSATNSNLEVEVAQGRFRSDLYYRLSEVILHVPPLRARPEDIPQFAMAFVQAAGERAGKYFESVEPELIRKLKQYDWPGNVRELRNAVDRMVILYDGPVLRAAWWEPPRPQPSSPGEPSATTASRTLPATAFNGGGSGPLNRRQKLDLARQLMESSGNDLTWVAAQLGIHPTTLYRWRKSGKV